MVGRKVGQEQEDHMTTGLQLSLELVVLSLLVLSLLVLSLLRESIALKRLLSLYLILSYINLATEFSALVLVEKTSLVII